MAIVPTKCSACGGQLVKIYNNDYPVAEVSVATELPPGCFALAVFDGDTEMLLVVEPGPGDTHRTVHRLVQGVPVYRHVKVKS